MTRLRVAYSGFSQPSATRIAAVSDEAHTVELVRSSSAEVDVNWGRSTANAALNPDISLTTNKRRMRRAFADHGVPMPRLLHEEVEDRNWGALSTYLTNGGVALGRPDRHTKQRGMWVVHNDAEVWQALRGTDRKHAATHFMEWVEAEREYRCHIFRGRSIRVSRKDFRDDGWTAVPAGDLPLRMVRDAARQAVAALGMDFGAVDILASGDRNEQVYVLEVNAAPGLGGTMPQVWRDTFIAWKEAQA